MISSNWLKKLVKCVLSVLGIFVGAGVMNPAQAATWFGVHLESYRTQTQAAAGWEEIRRALPDVAGGAPHRFVRVELPGKGVYYRVMVGPYTTQATAEAVSRGFQVAGRWANVMAVDELTPQAPAAPAIAPPTPVATSAPVAVSPPLPALAPVQAVTTAATPDTMPPGSAPGPTLATASRLPSAVLRPATASSEQLRPESAAALVPENRPNTAKAHETGQLLASRQAVPGASEGFAYALATKVGADPLLAAEIKTRSEAVKARARAQSNTSAPPDKSKAPDAGATKSKPDAAAKGGPAKVPEGDTPGPKKDVKPMVGNLPSEFAKKPTAAPTPNNDDFEKFRPYFGLGFSF